MPLVPHPDRTTPEAILSFGQFGTGKTEDWACIADAYRKYGNDGHFHVLSTEFERVLSAMEGRSRWRDNVTIYECEDWSTLLSASETIQKVTSEKCAARNLVPNTNDDWIVLDVAGPALIWARDLYFQRTREINYKDFLNTGKKATEVSSDEWGQMNSIYLTWFNEHFIRFPGHRYICAQADSYGEGAWAPKAGTTQNRLFSRLGLKPVGYKELGAQVHTVLYKTNPTPGEFTLSTVKDKPSRENLVHQNVLQREYGGFVVSYLQAVAGWTVEE